MEETPQEEIKKPKKDRSLIVIVILLLIIAGMFFWIVGYWMGNKKNNQSANASPTATVSPTPKLITTTADQYSGWKTYESSDYSLKFKYQGDWNDPTVTVNKKSDQGMIPIDYTNVAFKNSNGETVSVQLSKVSAYDEESAEIKSNVDKILKVYKTKGALGAEGIWLPYSNAGIQATNSAKYIETADGNYRGIYYFANISQGYSSEITAITIMTDGIENIFQLQYSAESANKDDYPCINSSSCSSEEMQADMKKFQDYVRNLDDSSSEPVVKELNGTLKKIAQSLEAV